MTQGIATLVCFACVAAVLLTVIGQLGVWVAIWQASRKPRTGKNISFFPPLFAVAVPVFAVGAATRQSHGFILSWPWATVALSGVLVVPYLPYLIICVPRWRQPDSN